MLLNCDVGEKSWESLDFKEIKPVNAKENQFWIVIERTDAEAEVPILWSHDAKSWLIGKDPDAGKDWGQEEKGMTEDETVGWHHQLDGHEFEQAPGDGEGQRSLVCCSPWVTRIRHNWVTELNWAELSLFWEQPSFPHPSFSCGILGLKKTEQRPSEKQAGLLRNRQPLRSHQDLCEFPPTDSYLRRRSPHIFMSSSAELLSKHVLRSL